MVRNNLVALVDHDDDIDHSSNGIRKRSMTAYTTVSSLVLCYASVKPLEFQLSVFGAGIQPESAFWSDGKEFRCTVLGFCKMHL